VLTVVIVRLGREIRRALRVALPAALLALSLASPAAAETLLVQPDGKIVFAHQASPFFGALARLNRDGRLDPAFGQGGFVIDQRTVGFPAIALQPGGRIVAAFGPGSLLTRYLPDGSPDPGFAGGGLGGTYEPGAPSHHSPVALLVQPGAEIVVAGNNSVPGGDYEAWVRRYDAAGALLETAGRVPLRSEAISAAGLTDLLERPNGSLIGTGWSDGDGEDRFRHRPFLARFLPKSGLDFDPSFGSGAGLANPNFPEDPNWFHSLGLTAIAQTEDKMLAAGYAARTFLLARFDAEGNLDPSFGQGGYVVPPIVGPVTSVSKEASELANSEAEDLAVLPDGDVIVTGGTSQWSTDWDYIKMLGLRCGDCPQPLLARFDPTGQLDSSFGTSGILRLLKPDGSKLLGDIDGVTVLADGKILVHGTGGYEAFVARLNPDGSYDSSFGDRGLAMLRFPCTNQDKAELRRTGCLPSAQMTLGLRGLRRGRPSLSLRMAPNLPWAAIDEMAIILPRGVRPTRKLKSRVRMTAAGGDGSRGSIRVRELEKRPGRTRLRFEDFGEARALRLKLRAGSLHTFGRDRLRRHSLRLRIEVDFVDATFREYFESSQTLVRRVRSAG
jgi:uncharacterized delta-60 repeat protein